MRTGYYERERLLWAGLFLAGVAISAFTILQGIDPFDEGLALQAARRVAAGQIIYRDFRWAYGPAEPYLLAGLIKLFGVSLLHWRILRSLTDGAIALSAYVLVRGYASRPLALASWLVVACEMSEPRNANPFPYALLAALVALWLADDQSSSRSLVRRVTGLVLLTAVAAAFRFDFAVYLGAAVTVVVVIRYSVRAAVAYVLAATALSALVYVPFAIADGPANLYHALITVSLQTGAYWSLPFPWVFHAPAHAGTGKTIKHAIDFYVPLAAVVGLVVIAATAALDTWRDRRPPALACGLVVFGAGMLAYLLTRTDAFHTQPLVVVVAIGLALSIPSLPRVAVVLPVALLALLLAHGAGNRLSALLRPPAEATIRIAAADGVMAPPREARAIERMVALVDSHVARGRPIYVLPRRSDLVTLADPLIYVMAERPNPSDADFALQTSAAGQAQIVRLLERVRPRVIVRWTDPISSQPEPNLRGRSSGVHTVDRWVAVHYRVLARLYHYDVLIARG